MLLRAAAAPTPVDNTGRATIITPDTRSIFGDRQRVKILGTSLGSADLVVTGAGGRLGRLLRAALPLAGEAGFRARWCGRGQDADIRWDILHDPAPRWPSGAVVLHLAGVVRGGAEALADNARMIGPLAQACRRNSARAVFLASTAAVHAPGPVAPDETVAATPVSDYGRAKLAAEQALLADNPGCPVTILRLGNIVGADALLGPRSAGDRITLDPVPQTGAGPVRSWIGPIGLVHTIAALVRMAQAGRPLPPVLNVAAQPPLPMDALLRASGRDWGWGPQNPNVVPFAALDSTLLNALCPLPVATAHGLIAELRQVSG